MSVLREMDFFPLLFLFLLCCCIAAAVLVELQGDKNDLTSIKNSVCVCVSLECSSFLVFREGQRQDVLKPSSFDL